MFPVFESEVFHRREHWAERVGNLCHGRYLPVEVLAVDSYGKGIHLGLTTGIAGIDLHTDSPPGELEIGTVEAEVLCCIHKFQEMWNGKRKLVEEYNLELLEARDGDLMNKCFQVVANTSEHKVAKVGKCHGCYDRRMRELPL